MARVTVEDCIDKVTNRFDLVMMSAQRAREISAGAAITLDRDNDKNPVVALREIAEEKVQPDALEESLIKTHQKRPQIERDAEEAVGGMIPGQDDWQRQGVSFDQDTRGEEGGMVDFSGMDVDLGDQDI